jgi:hypothetical protein
MREHKAPPIPNPKRQPFLCGQAALRIASLLIAEAQWERGSAFVQCLQGFLVSAVEASDPVIAEMSFGADSSELRYDGISLGFTYLSLLLGDLGESRQTSDVLIGKRR